ncbi:MAG TPA: hypothetical protein PLY87_10195 [Planctomycetaceae bacterium]|nr:hypothetical protein [Planctomycetaceae bacterium]HQZ65437.1 hypothetical protein [Planctomycetaceae bacterium]HRA86434.1 hypothetical protein [Planctomycetaceae bacterium]
MSQDSPSSDATSSPAAATGSPELPDLPDRVFLVSYPKIMFLYPTVITALFCGIFMWAKGGIPQEEIRVVAPGAEQVAGTAEYSVPIARATLSAQAGDTFQIPPVEESASPPLETGEVPAAVANDTASGAPATDAPKVQKAERTFHNVCARTFLLVMALNLVVISFDFPRTTSLTWFFAFVAIVIGLWFTLTKFDGLAPEIVTVLLKIKPAANASFYLIFTGIMLFLYICVLISRRFDYWEVKGNELLHHHGFLSNLERFSAPNLRIDKEINDVFEYMLLRSGRLIIHASNERRAIVLDDVLFINKKEERITKMLGALQVRVRTDKE